MCELLMGHVGLSPFVRTPPTGQPADKETSGRKGCVLYHQVAGWSRVDTRYPVPGNHEIESPKGVVKKAPLGTMASTWMSVTCQQGYRSHTYRVTTTAVTNDVRDTSLSSPP